MSIWVLTKEYNDYNQYGEYYIAAFKEKPSTEMIKTVISCSDEMAAWILSGGGREGVEDVWYNLVEEK